MASGYASLLRANGSRPLAYFTLGWPRAGLCLAQHTPQAARSWLGAPWRPAVPRRGTPRFFWRSCWAGEGLWGYQEGQMGQNLALCAQLGAARSRQDESIEVGEVGSKRPSLGGTGGHVVWCSGLIFWLLAITRVPLSLYLGPRLVNVASCARSIFCPVPATQAMFVS